MAQNAFRAASGERFRVLQFSVQADHVHLLAEADGPTAFERGVRGLAVRVAKAVNRVLVRRGTVWADRYHARLLRTPREMRNALVYVLDNWKNHIPAARGLDARSSARWFDGWRDPVARPSGRSPVAIARTWLARVGWRRYGLVDPREGSRSHRGRARRGGGHGATSPRPACGAATVIAASRRRHATPFPG